MSFFDNIRNSQSGAPGLDAGLTRDRSVVLEAEPSDLEGLKKAVDVSDPGSVAGYWIYAVTCLTIDYDTGMSMMKYLFADIEPFGRGFIEGGGVGRAGWDPYFNERLKDDEYRWLPRAYFAGSVASNYFTPPKPLTVDLHYNKPNTDTVNAQTLKQLGRLNVV